MKNVILDPTMGMGTVRWIVNLYTVWYQFVGMGSGKVTRNAIGDTNTMVVVKVDVH